MEIKFEGGKVITALYNGHIIRTDQPIDNGGGNTAPSPFDLYMASIGTCAGIYVKTFCDKRGIPTENIKVVQNIKWDKVTDLPLEITVEIKLPPDFPEKYKTSVINAAELCKVKKSVANPPVFKVISSKM